MLVVNFQNWRGILLALVAALAFAPHADAAVAFDNFPTRQNQGAGYQVGSFGAPIAIQFQSATTGKVDVIDLAINSYPTVAAFTARLYADAGNNLGAMLKQWTGVTTVAGFSNYASITNSDPTVTLLSGQSYWLMAFGNADIVWSFPNPGASGRLWFGGNSFANQPVTAFAVSTQFVAAVPETSSVVSWSLVGLCIGTIACYRKRTWSIV